LAYRREYTEKRIISPQDQALNTKYYATEVLKTTNVSKCEMCEQFRETVEHLIARCPDQVEEEYANIMIRPAHNCISLSLNY
jgi:hypothetical protein